MKFSYKKPTKRAAIVIPMHNRPGFTADEEISLRHLERHLGAYDRYFVAPRGLAVARSGYRVKYYSPRFFGSVEANRALLFAKHFYRGFLDYEYILIYHLDALVFSDDLEYWCDQGYDYIGAPWFEDRDAPERGFRGVGNGGFSLRDVRAFLRVLDSEVYKIEPNEYWRRYYSHRAGGARLKGRIRTALKHLRLVNGVRWHLRQYKPNEDLFWSYCAHHYDPGFRIADPMTALRFAFEVQPGYSLELTDGRLPFGCHAWPVYDREFWEPYLLPDASGAAGSAGAA